MENIAPAVMNGGFSSLLALSLLVSSHSHIFISFFKIFFMICVFGLFHGLITLPVVLTIIGPAEDTSHPAAKRASLQSLHIGSLHARNGSVKHHNGGVVTAGGLDTLDSDNGQLGVDLLKHHRRTVSCPVSDIGNNGVPVKNMQCETFDFRRETNIL